MGAEPDNEAEGAQVSATAVKVSSDPLAEAELALRSQASAAQDRAINVLGTIVQLLKGMSADECRASMAYLRSRFGGG
jgi:hypothetical protein